MPHYAPKSTVRTAWSMKCSLLFCDIDLPYHTFLSSEEYILLTGWVLTYCKRGLHDNAIWLLFRCNSETLKHMLTLVWSNEMFLTLTNQDNHA